MSIDCVRIVYRRVMMSADEYEWERMRTEYGWWTDEYGWEQMVFEWIRMIMDGIQKITDEYG